MKTIREKYKMAGGVHLRHHKDMTRHKAVEDMPLPALLRVSMAQHIGAPAQPVVNKKDVVLRGQIIGEAAGLISAAVHAPTSGAVKSVEEAPTPLGTRAMAVEIESDGEDRWAPDISPHPDWESLAPKQLVSFISAAGVVGMGGAGFPTHVKLSPPADKPIDTLIINGAECEPYLTADHRLMLEHPDKIWDGCRIIRKILGARSVRVAIEDNKPDAAAAMEKALADAEGDVAIVILDTRYPQGAEKQQIFAVTGREVPLGGLPMDVGTIVENVGTAMAVWDAVVNGRPLTERIVTVTGAPVNRPANVRARVGTLYADLVKFCGGISGQAAKAIDGGPMMGLAQHSLDVATTKTTSGLLFLPPDAVEQYTSMPCISCGRCVEACQMRLMPCELSRMLEAEDYEAAEQYDVMCCIECGSCAFQCPAHRPLAQQMRLGKAYVAQKRARAEVEK